MKKYKKRAIYGVVSLAAVYLVAVIGSAVISGWEPPPRAVRGRDAASSRQLRVATFNVYYEAAPQASADAVAQIDADILCLQESTKAWEEFSQKQLAERYPYRIFHHEPYAGGMAVLSRWPISELGYDRPPGGWFSGLSLKAQTPQGDVKFLNVHLRSMHPGKIGLGYLDYVRLASIHAGEMEFLYTKLAAREPSMPAIVLGDFNEGDDGSAVKYLTKHTLSDAVPAFDKTTRTWQGRIAGITLWARPDRVLYSSQFKCIDAGIVKAGASDHSPVLAVLHRSE